MLDRVHRPWIHVNIRIKFLHRDLIAPRLEKSPQRRRRNPFSKTGYYSSCYKNIVYHCLSFLLFAALKLPKHKKRGKSVWKSLFPRFLTDTFAAFSFPSFLLFQYYTLFFTFCKSLFYFLSDPTFLPFRNRVLIVKTCLTDSKVSHNGLKILDLHIAKGIRADECADLLSRVL